MKKRLDVTWADRMAMLGFLVGMLLMAASIAVWSGISFGYRYSSDGAEVERAKEVRVLD